MDNLLPSQNALPNFQLRLVSPDPSIKSKWLKCIAPHIRNEFYWQTDIHLRHTIAACLSQTAHLQQRVARPWGLRRNRGVSREDFDLPRQIFMKYFYVSFKYNPLHTNEAGCRDRTWIGRAQDQIHKIFWLKGFWGITQSLQIFVTAPQSNVIFNYFRIISN
jgi:hypothetical protein